MATSNNIAELGKMIVNDDESTSAIDGAKKSLQYVDQEFENRLDKLAQVNQDAQLKSNCEFISKFLEELCMANYDIMSPDSIDKIKKMKNDMKTFIKFHDETIEGIMPSSKESSVKQLHKNNMSEVKSNLQAKVKAKQETSGSETERD